MPLDAKELAKEKELNRELSDEEMDRLLIPRRSIGTWLTFGLIVVGLIGGAGYLFGARVLKAGRDYAASRFSRCSRRNSTKALMVSELCRCCG